MKEGKRRRKLMKICKNCGVNDDVRICTLLLLKAVNKLADDNKKEEKNKEITIKNEPNENSSSIKLK